MLQLLHKDRNLSATRRHLAVSEALPMHKMGKHAFCGLGRKERKKYFAPTTRYIRTISPASLVAVLILFLLREFQHHTEIFAFGLSWVTHLAPIRRRGGEL